MATESMLELRSSCEHCGKALPNDAFLEAKRGVDPRKR